MSEPSTPSEKAHAASERPIWREGWWLFRVNFLIALLAAVSELGVQIGKEFGLNVGIQFASTIVWFYLLFFFHATALGSSGTRAMGVKARPLTRFVTRSFVLLFVFIIVPSIIGAIAVVGSAQQFESESQLLVATAIFVGTPLAICSLVGFTIFGTMLPAIVDDADRSFSAARRRSRGMRWWIGSRLALWLGLVYGLSIVIIVTLGGLQESIVGFPPEYIIHPDTYAVDAFQIAVLLLGYLIQGYAMANGATVLSRAYKRIREKEEPNNDVA